MARKPKNPAYPISWKEAERLVNGLFRHGKYRHSAYVKISVSFGFRFFDTSRITWGDILNGKTHYRTTEQKTGKKVARMITPSLVEHISRCSELLGCPDMSEPVLRSQKARADGTFGIVSPQSMNMTAKRQWIDLYDLDIDPENFSQHTFRKTSAMRIYEINGNDIIAAKNWLNHERVDMTERYLLLTYSQTAELSTE